MFSFFNGIGRRYYGHRNIEIGHIFITTKWLTVLSFPLLPLGSFQMVVHQKTSQLIGTKTKFQLSYQRLERLPLNWFQVLHVYVRVALTLLLMMGIAWLIIRPVI